MKYPDGQAVEAIYTANPLSGAQPNPFLEVMPDMLPKEDLFRRLSCSPPPPDPASLVRAADRRRGLNALLSVYVPMDYMAVIYETLYCAMESTYTTRTTIDSIRRVHAIHCIGKPVPGTHSCPFETGRVAGGVYRCLVIFQLRILASSGTV